MHQPVSSCTPSSLPFDLSHPLSPTQQVELLYKYNYLVRLNLLRSGLWSLLLVLDLLSFELGRLSLGRTLGMLGRLSLGLGSSGPPLYVSCDESLDGDSLPLMTRVVTSGSAVTPEGFHSPSPKLIISSHHHTKKSESYPLVFSITPIHLDSPNESATSLLAPIRLNLVASTRASA